MASNYTDPLESLLYPDRVNYANGVMLDENDFRAECVFGKAGKARSVREYGEEAAWVGSG